MSRELLVSAFLAALFLTSVIPVSAPEPPSHRMSSRIEFLFVSSGDSDEANCTITCFLTNGEDHDVPVTFELPVETSGRQIKNNFFSYSTNILDQGKKNVTYATTEEQGIKYVIFACTGLLPAGKTGFLRVSYLDETFFRQGGRAAYDYDIGLLEVVNADMTVGGTVVIELPTESSLGEYLGRLYVDWVAPTPSESFVMGAYQVFVWRDPLMTSGNGTDVLYRAEIVRHYAPDWSKVFFVVLGVALTLFISGSLKWFWEKIRGMFGKLGQPKGTKKNR
jgi:hypothetical protein